jgi:uncharacterized protein (TIGR00369 family)
VALGDFLTSRHFLSDLGMEAEVTSESSASVRIPVTPHVLGPDGGVRAGVLATLVDVVGGSAALRTLQPDWMATADLTVQTARPAAGPFVEARATVLRKGRTTLVVEALVVDVAADGSDVVDAAGVPAPAAWATMTFAVMAGRTGAPMRDVSADLPVRWSMAGGALEAPVVDTLAISVEDAAAGQVSLEVREYVRNSFGAVQGGVMALLAEVAATEMLGAASGSAGSSMVVTDLQVAYLALGRVGPIVTRSTRLDAGAGPERGSVVVELIDQGAGDRLTTVVNVGTRPAGRSRGSRR